jgi:nitrogen regulatory protein P-II 2
METHPMKLVNIICEALARETLERLLDEIGAHGFTVFGVEGRGRHGERLGEMEGFANVQFEVILPAEAASRLLERLEKEFFPRYAMVAYETDIRVLRPQKF